MSRRCTWGIGVLVGLAITALLACNSTYNAALDGLVVVPTFGSAVMEAFSFNLTNGHVSTVNTAPPIVGQPTAMVLDPSGSYAYVTILPNPYVFQTISLTSIATYSIGPNGGLSTIGTPLTMLTICPTGAAPPTWTSCPTGSAGAGNLSPVALTMDSAGKFLFVADQQTSDSSGNLVPGSISVFSIGSGGALTEVAGSPFTVQTLQAGPVTTPNLVGLAITPTKYPVLNTQAVQNAACALWQPLPASTPEYLYVTDANNDVVWGFTVQSSGALVPIANPLSGVVLSFPAQSVTTGVAVDPCNRFVFVTNTLSNNVNAYAICNLTSPGRPQICNSNQYPEGSLVQVPSSPFALGGGGAGPNGPTVLEVDPLANFLYVVDHLSNQLSCFRISADSGSLAPLSTAAVATGISPTAIAIRADDNWVFVVNDDVLNGAGSVSQYELSPATGVLTPFSTGISTDNYPTAVVVK